MFVRLFERVYGRNLWMCPFEWVYSSDLCSVVAVVVDMDRNFDKRMDFVAPVIGVLVWPVVAGLVVVVAAAAAAVGWDC